MGLDPPRQIYEHREQMTKVLEKVFFMDNQMKMCDGSDPGLD